MSIIQDVKLPPPKNCLSHSKFLNNMIPLIAYSQTIFAAYELSLGSKFLLICSGQTPFRDWCIRWSLPPISRLSDQSLFAKQLQIYTGSAYSSRRSAKWQNLVPGPGQAPQNLYLAILPRGRDRPGEYWFIAYEFLLKGCPSSISTTEIIRCITHLSLIDM